MSDMPELVSVDEHGNPVDRSALEDAGVAFDPTSQHLDLTKDEKRRTTALMLAIQGYKELIIRDAAYLREVADLARRDEGPKISPATVDAMVDAAIKFDMFISGATLAQGIEARRVETPQEAPCEAQEPDPGGDAPDPSPRPSVNTTDIG